MMLRQRVRESVKLMHPGWRAASAPQATVFGRDTHSYRMWCYTGVTSRDFLAPQAGSTPCMHPFMTVQTSAQPTCTSLSVSFSVNKHPAQQPESLCNRSLLAQDAPYGLMVTQAMHPAAKCLFLVVPSPSAPVQCFACVVALHVVCCWLMRTVLFAHVSVTRLRLRRQSGCSGALLKSWA